MMRYRTRWDARKPSNTIICNGKECRISPDLNGALRALRKTNENRFIWVDAFCINQCDKIEKGIQIQLRERIFRKAAAVQVWMGNNANIPQLSEVVALLKKHSIEQGHFKWSKEGDIGPAVRPDPEVLVYFRELLDSIPWFARSFIRLEVASARQILILNPGGKLLLWKNLAAVGTWTLLGIRRAGRGSQSFCTGLTVDNLTSLVFLSQKEKFQDCISVDFFRWLLLSGAVFQATDERDKLYSLAAAFNGNFSGTEVNDFVDSEGSEDSEDSEDATPSQPWPKMTVDYDKTETEVFSDMTTRAMDSTGTLSVLEMHDPESSGLSRSWAVNWNDPSLQTISILAFQHACPTLSLRHFKNVVDCVFEARKVQSFYACAKREQWVADYRRHSAADRRDKDMTFIAQRIWNYKESLTSSNENHWLNRLYRLEAFDGVNDAALCVQGISIGKISSSLKALQEDPFHRDLDDANKSLSSNHWIHEPYWTEAFRDTRRQFIHLQGQADVEEELSANLPPAIIRQIQYDRFQLHTRECIRDLCACMLFPLRCQRGDLVVWLNGAYVPMVIRRRKGQAGNSGHKFYSYVGQVLMMPSAVPSIVRQFYGGPDVEQYLFKDTLSFDVDEQIKLPPLREFRFV